MSIKYLELETVINDILPETGGREFEAVINGLGININEAIPASYSDLVLAAK